MNASAPAPQLSVVLVTRGGLDALRLTISALAEQTMADAIELVIVAPAAGVLEARRPGELAAFHSAVEVAAGPIDDVDAAAAAGLLRARAPFAASIEDHVFPSAGWAREIVAAFASGPWAVVGGRMTNANPGALSWANLLITDVAGATGDGGERTAPFSSHNVAYRVEALRPYGERLPDLMGRDGGLMADLLARGQRLYVAPAARYAHLQVTRWTCQVALHLRSGRNAGAARARAAGWSRARRVAQAGALPLVPALLAGRRLRAGHSLGLTNRVLAPLLVAATLHSVGEAIGYLRGPGRTRAQLSVFETERRRHLSRRDRTRHDRLVERYVGGGAGA